MSFLLALNFFRHSTVSCLCIMDATVDRCCWRKVTTTQDCKVIETTMQLCKATRVQKSQTSRSGKTTVQWENFNSLRRSVVVHQSAALERLQICESKI